MYGNFIDLNYRLLSEMLLRAVPALVCVTLHEYAHGYTAYRLGDDTAKMSGRLSLNPIRHIDIFGLLMLLVAGFGWAKPVPVNMFRFRSPKKDMAITALAGPVMNIIIAAVAMFIVGFTLNPLWSFKYGKVVINILSTTAYLSCAFAVFNMLPIPPLDGSKIFFSFLPDRQYYSLMAYERYGMFFLLAIVVTGVISRPLTVATEYIYNFLFVFAQVGSKLASIFF